MCEEYSVYPYGVQSYGMPYGVTEYMVCNKSKRVSPTLIYQ